MEQEGPCLNCLREGSAYYSSRDLADQMRQALDSRAVIEHRSGDRGHGRVPAEQLSAVG